MKVRCPKCGTSLRFPEDPTRQVGKCPKCRTRFQLGQASAQSATAEHTYALKPGTVFSSLRIERPLGAGGMAEVYLATQLSLGRYVAVKILPEWLTENPQALARFDREGRVLADLRHPNIVSVIDRGRTGEGRYYIVMDYIDGTTLQKQINREPLSSSATAAITLKLCGALQHAHDRGIVHRDLKPGNILLDKSGTPYIADFGIANMAADRHGSADITMTGVGLGTPGYIAPEQIQNTKTVDHRADIYSLGAIMYELKLTDFFEGTIAILK